MEQLFSPWRSQYIASFANESNDDGCVLCAAYESRNDEESLILHRGSDAFVIMNRYPYNSGHLMIVPVRHTSDFQALTRAEELECLDLIKVSEQALAELSKPQGFNIGMNLGRVAGAGIDDHLHWHIVPRWNGDTNFFPVLADVKVVSEDMHAQWRRLRDLFSKAKLQ
ncbi:MAG: HIT domain-containing protein [Bacteroidota bacterium]|nr:HIT domain-containing protein [Bacteroidota bacterium]MDP4232039.1 HIT domain-containing protein [Bacteroidota bacterium]MDP4241254.1 HIT domain-containing protein [Bacteroidota bacterium]MDP4286646.1 HIT domain-containing protein [Bacteroidota bacterium]